jgi:L-glutamine-phosphate cytidylyltransferase
VRAIILAAGRGSRMGMLTHRHPKCLTVLGGKPLLQWQLEALHKAGIREVAVVRGYRSEILQGTDYAVFDNLRWEKTNMVMSLACAQPWLESGPCIVSYADILYHPAWVKALINGKGTLAITYDRFWYPLWRERFDDPLSDAETFRVTPDGLLQAIGDRANGLEEIEGQYMGLIKLTPEGWNLVESYLHGIPDEQRDKLDMTGLLRSLLREGAKISAVPVEGRWCEVDCEKDLRLYEKRLESGASWTHDWRF